MVDAEVADGVVFDVGDQHHRQLARLVVDREMQQQLVDDATGRLHRVQRIDARVVSLKPGMRLGDELGWLLLSAERRVDRGPACECRDDPHVAVDEPRIERNQIVRDT